jgi:polyisoprenyl-phosphate glycosyltransferase
MTAKTLSIVVPCHNEQEVLPLSYESLTSLAQEWTREGIISDYELVFVNNGSTDSTLNVMLGMVRSDPKVVVVDLKANYGYQGSITAGIHHASCDMIVTIDADLQDDPAKIREMVLKHYEGFEMVLGVRSERKTDTLLKRAGASIYYRLLQQLGVTAIPHHGDFRLMSRPVAEAFAKFPERNRYLRAMIFDLDSRYTCVYYSRRARTAGTTKFRPARLISLGLDGITSYSSRPVRLVFMLGLLMFMLSLAGICYVAFIKLFTDRSVPGWASTSAILLFFFGLQNLSIGIIGEYISRIYLEVKQRPLYLVRTVHRGKNPEL